MFTLRHIVDGESRYLHVGVDDGVWVIICVGTVYNYILATYT